MAGLTPGLTLSRAANGRLTLEFTQPEGPQWRLTVRILQRELGFERDGETISGLDEGLLPAFVNDEIRLHAGWDHWSGTYLLSQCSGGDEVLSALANRLARISHTSP